MRLLKPYLNLLAKNVSPFPCPHCHDIVLAKHFEQHCVEKHELNRDLHCAWCFGNRFWTQHTLPNRVQHLTVCYASFLVSRESVSPPIASRSGRFPSVMPTFDLKPMCPEKMFGHHVPLPHLPETPVWAIQPVVQGLTFDCPRLNLAIGCIETYLSLKESTDWMHVMVKPPAYLSFLKAVDDDAGKTCTLPFSCFCVGGGLPHRHFIVFSSPRNHFLKVTWKKIQCTKKGDNIKRDTIFSPMQLVHVIGSLSQDRSKCHFTFNPPETDPTGECNRYYIAVSLPPIYKIILASRWDGGLLELVYQAYTSVDPQQLIPIVQSYNGLLGIRFRDLPGLFTHCVLPVSRKFEAVLTETPYYISLFHQKKMFFQLVEKPLEDVEIRRAEITDRFCEALGEAIYYPTPYQQKCIRSTKPILDEMFELKCTLIKAEGKVNALDASLSSLKKSNKSLKRKYNGSEEQLKRLQRRHIEYLEKENDKLRKKLFEHAESK